VCPQILRSAYAMFGPRRNRTAELYASEVERNGGFGEDLVLGVVAALLVELAERPCL
jgi:hypothetical protein